jgi:hypothetical protein
VLQSRQHDLLARLFDLTCEKNFIEYSIHLKACSGNISPLSLNLLRPLIEKSSTNLVEVEDQVQLTYISKELIKNFHEEVYGLQVG